MLERENKEKLLECLSKTIKKDISEVKEIEETAILSDYGLESITFIQFIVAVEDTLGITVNDSDLLFSNFDTLEKMFTTLGKYLKNEFKVCKKCLVLDCDNILWKGIAAEGEIIPNISLQEKAVSLSEKGVLICLCSKNDEAVVREAFESHKDMPIKWEQIVAYRINWLDKAENIKSLAKELNIATDSMVFIDDSDYEIGAVEALLPEVLALKLVMGQEQSEIDLHELFDIEILTEEGKNRSELYIQQKSREKAKQRFNTIEDYNASLQTKLNIRPATAEDFPRIIEMSLRTNQFNLSMKRYDKAALYKIGMSDKYMVTVMEASDIYGDMGIIGTSVLRFSDIPCIEAFMLSCRVIGRGFEYSLLSKLKQLAADKGCESISGIYFKTEKNARFENFYTDNGIVL